MMIGSGCQHNLIEPLCLPDRPELIDVSNADKYELWVVNPDTVTALARNDARLKSHIKTIEGITAAHNEQFEAQCYDDNSSP